MASIAFTDTVGAATLQSASPSPGNRLSGWVADGEPIGPAEVTLAGGVTHRWVFRTDDTATFNLPGLTPSQLTIAVRLKVHLMNGGTCVVTTNDSGARVHTVRLAPGTVPTISAMNEDWEHTFSMVAKNTIAGTMLATYSGPSS